MESITAEQAKKQEGKQVGISLSGCICDIINGRINEEEVEEIIAMTGMDISRKEGLEAVIDFYKNSAYWEKCPEEAAETCRRLWGKGKIVHCSKRFRESLTRNAGAYWMIK